ncbi:hypothetical protein MWT96_24690 (plasmid) [Prescottella equi]|uniref:Uncharacterized protein n=1 Tax=Rhodococcus hoagii TaxID=43767 RepID=A0A9Q2PI73_RHOHA|nr:hypothetical protein [Prescottella equi]MBM4487804.1 hypothetical protein [Prescottella equi]MBM4487821.1 hypothetical protein [Prescottella equi]MBM4492193.1 hypothetical protein [Prescottella equi]MBM4492198.1 hypothetical protein [Prescottella equi]MBM4492205.1 hypothetical protein [Prescottella equi]
MSTPPSEPLLSLRSAVLLLIAALIGIGVGVLTVFAGQPVATAIIAGGGAGGASLMALEKLIR